jgi:hypothetical protein
MVGALLPFPCAHRAKPADLEVYLPTQTTVVVTAIAPLSVEMCATGTNRPG